MRYHIDMNSNMMIWLERLTTLHKSQMRKAANAEGMPFVHLEILQYLSICNHYSNTAQALSDYLGQTKGSISQSLKIIEDKGYIIRKPCIQDGRVTRLYLTEKSKDILERIQHLIFPDQDAEQVVASLKKIVKQWHIQTGSSGFGQCLTCRFWTVVDEGNFKCGLTGEPLSKENIKLLCQEHEFPEECSPNG